MGSDLDYLKSRVKANFSDDDEEDEEDEGDDSEEGEESESESEGEAEAVKGVQKGGSRTKSSTEHGSEHDAAAAAAADGDGDKVRCKPAVIGKQPKSACSAKQWNHGPALCRRSRGIVVCSVHLTHHALRVHGHGV